MKSVWLIDADRIDFQDSNNFNLYKNSYVKSFLDETRQFAVSSNKGIGKTFLLKIKRFLLQNQTGIMCLPKNVMLDMPEPPSFSNSTLKFFEDYNNWVDLWKVSIILSLFAKNCEFHCLIAEEISDHDTVVINSLNLPYNRTCEFFNYLLSLNRSDINILLRKTPDLMSLLPNIRHGVSIFIDKIDQAFSKDVGKIYGQTKMSVGPRNASFWQYAQFALLEAAYIIYLKNPHIKIYFSIRREALLDAEQLNDKFLQLRSYIADIDYSYDELEEMYKLYIHNEIDENLVYPDKRNVSPSYAFCGIDEFEHGYVTGKYETAFEYMYRHSLFRPRDIMDICYHLYMSNLRTSKNIERDFRHIVNQESRIILESYLSELEKIIFKLDREHLNYLSSLINFNAMDLEYMKYVCGRFNREKGEISICTKICDECKGIHPFTQLHNVGLIGTIISNNMHEFRQKYLESNETLIDIDGNNLPSSPVYFLHPCLSNKVQSIRKEFSRDFKVVNEIIGNNIILKKDEIKKIEYAVQEKLSVEKELFDERIFVSSTQDLKDIRERIKTILKKSGRNVIMSGEDNFNAEAHNQHAQDHCIEEMLKCKMVITIIGSNYGSEYAGEKYKSYKGDLTDRELLKPSNTLIEYIAAKKNNIPIYVFVSLDVYNELQTYHCNDPNTFKPAYAKENRVFHVIDYVNKQERGNWFIPYSGINHLEELIRIHFDVQN